MTDKVVCEGGACLHEVVDDADMTPEALDVCVLLLDIRLKI